MDAWRYPHFRPHGIEGNVRTVVVGRREENEVVPLDATFVAKGVLPERSLMLDVVSPNDDGPDPNHDASVPSSVFRRQKTPRRVRACFLALLVPADTLRTALFRRVRGQADDRSDTGMTSIRPLPSAVGRTLSPPTSPLVITAPGEVGRKRATPPSDSNVESRRP